MRTDGSDGGPAFAAAADMNLQPGMSLRDYFAGHALTAIAHIHNGKAVDPSGCANAAYEYADAMLARREK